MIHTGPMSSYRQLEEGARGLVRERFEDAAGFGDEGRAPEPKDAGESKEKILLQSSQKEHSAADILIVAW